MSVLRYFSVAIFIIGSSIAIEKLLSNTERIGKTTQLGYYQRRAGSRVRDHAMPVPIPTQRTTVSAPLECLQPVS